MSKLIYVVRHCKAEGQEPEAPLTEQGKQQANQLAAFFNKRPDRIISSPFIRAQQSVDPLASKWDMEIETDPRLAERVLSKENLSDWFEKLRITFEDLELTYPGGESSNKATQRIVSVIEELEDDTSTILATHGNLLSLLLMYIDPNYGFEDWSSLTNPDVFELNIANGKATIHRIWEK
ncbi:histidine phosphatase family protein [Virgibacillus halodenitrificans]|uniref:Histidine phosphatase family protein n=1 Tax=Virgibacillus halodenitrificans TaxID=1482 RepID=A0AAC9J638_VIRHA|nr:histidine phosphatase family protein [Virgibacillus halodenitrificans]APC50000.1 histidine phosphatase family protein [Virgibacillus halodenitrificans]